MSNDWKSGWREWYELHKNDSENVIFDEFNKRSAAFDYTKFVEHYNNLSDEEWQDVVADAAKEGHDLRCVFYYKKECGNELFPVFDIRCCEEIIEVLLDLDGASALLPLRDKYIPCPDIARCNIEERYVHWNLPVPKYWRDRLWT